MRENFKITFLSLIISFTTMLPISAFTAIKLMKSKQSPTNQNKKKSDFEYSDFEYIIPKKEDLNLLISVTDKFPNPAKVYILTKISAHDNSINIANIPKNLEATVNKTKGTIEKLHYIGGIDYAKQAIENVTKTEIDRTIELDSNSVSGICESLGGIKVEDGKKAEKKFTILSGEEFYKKIIKSPIESITAIKNCLDINTNLSNLYITIANLGKTDISIYDFEKRKKGFEKLIEKKDATIKILKLIEKKKNALPEEKKKEYQEMFKKNM